MKNFLLIYILVLTSVASANAQSVLADWEGTYEGEMIIGSTIRQNDTAKVTFELIPLEVNSTWTYRMTYVNKKYGTIVKDYQLTRVEESKVDFLLDERDGIVIEMSLMNDCFYSVFEVLGGFYSTSLRRSGESLQFDLFSSNKKDGTVTKNEDEDPDNIFKVTSYKPGLHQTIRFIKQNQITDEEKITNQKALEAYEKLVDAADEAYAVQNFEKALKLYVRATTLMPSNEYAHRQKLKTEKRLAE